MVVLGASSSRSSSKGGGGGGASDLGATVPVVAHVGKRKKAPPRQALSRMSEDDARLELAALDAELDKHAHAYYVLDAPEISDAAFDKLVRRAEDLEGKFESLRGSVKHLLRVGMPPRASSKFASFNHTKPLLSLDNALNEQELDKFFTKVAAKLGGDGVEYVVEPKIDGLSLALHYRNGQLVGAGTRGDGTVGEDVTANARMIADVPKTISVPDSLDSGLVEVRGEVYLSTEDFRALNERRVAANLSLHATARNAAAGSLRQLDPETVRERNLRFFAYELRGAPTGDSLANSQLQTLSVLQELGFSVAKPWKLYTLPADSGLLKGHLADLGSSLRPSLGFDTDGAVVKINHFKQREIMGQLSRYPNWAVAYKFQAQEAETVLEDIVVQVGRTGVLTPVAKLRKVLIGGVFVERATLHNEDEVRRLQLRPGLTVRVKRTGDVIPKVVGVVNQIQVDGEGTGDGDAGVSFSLPSSCPVCGSRTEREEGGILVRCTGSMVCAAQAVEKIRHFCSRDAADIEGFGGMTAEDLHSLGLVKSPADIYRLRKLDLDSRNTSSSGSADEYGDVALPLRGRKGWGDRSVNNLLDAIDKRRSLPLQKFIFALGVRHVGQETAKDLAQKFRSFDALWGYIKGEADKENSDAISGQELLSIDGVGPKASAALLALASDERSRTEVEALLSELKVVDYDGPGREEQVAASEFDPTTLRGQKVVFTGKLQRLTRKKAEAFCIQRGATIGSAVTRDTTLLVEGGQGGGGETGASTKGKKARDLGVKVLSEEAFVEMFGVADE